MHNAERGFVLPMVKKLGFNGLPKFLIPKEFKYYFRRQNTKRVSGPQTQAGEAE